MEKLPDLNQKDVVKEVCDQYNNHFKSDYESFQEGLSAKAPENISDKEDLKEKKEDQTSDEYMDKVIRRQLEEENIKSADPPDVTKQASKPVSNPTDVPPALDRGTSQSAPTEIKGSDEDIHEAVKKSLL